MWLAVLVTWGVRSNAAALLGGVSLALLPAITQNYLPNWTSNVTPVLFGLGAVSAAKYPDGVLAEQSRRLRSLVLHVRPRSGGHGHARPHRGRRGGGPGDDGSRGGEHLVMPAPSRGGPSGGRRDRRSGRQRDHGPLRGAHRALSVSIEVQPGEDRRPGRSQRGGEVHAARRAVGPAPTEQRSGLSARRRRDQRVVPVPLEEGSGPDVPTAGAVHGPDRARAPRAGPPCPGGAAPALARHARSALALSAGAGRDRAGGRAARAVAADQGGESARGGTAPRRLAPGRGRQGAGQRAERPPPGRAALGSRHQGVGEPVGGLPADRRPAWPSGVADHGRARRGRGPVAVRHRVRARLRGAHRRRHTRGDSQRPCGAGRLPGGLRPRTWSARRAGSRRGGPA